METTTYTPEREASALAYREARLQLNAAQLAYRDASWGGIPAKVNAAQTAKDAADAALAVAGKRFAAAFEEESLR